jgi:hypothetical protein
MPKEMSYTEFRAQVDSFKTLLTNAQKGQIEILILDLISEHSPKFMHYKALEMIEEGDFDDDLSVRGYFKRLLYSEVLKDEEAARNVVVFKTDEELIAELNQSTFLDKHPNYVPIKPGATQAFFDAQMSAIVEHPYPNQDL